MNQYFTISTEHLIEQLATITGVTSKRMFGGHGIFHNDKMFGLFTAKGHRYFKANESTLTKYTAKGSEKHSRMPYYSIPEDVAKDSALLVEWAKKSIEASK